MKILHITDSHGTVKSPESRTDVYYIAFLRKIYELGYVVKQQKIDMVIHTGDLFHTARVSDKFAGQVSELIKAMGVPFYVVPGNHDIEGYTTDTIDQTKLGLLAKAGVVTILDRNNPISITANQNGEEYTVAISGQEYYAHIDEGNPQDFDMQQDEADLNILAVHAYLTDTPQHPDIKCTMVNDVVTDADIILTGHYHRSFEWDGPDVSIYNPGSMMRVEQTEYNKTHMPQYGILDISLNQNGDIVYDYMCHVFKVAEPSTSVFDYSAKYKAKHASISLDGFKNSIANTMSNIQPSATIDKIITDICQNSNVDVALEQAALDVYHDALQNAPDSFGVQPGFIESHKPKKIVRVILDNFQSHKHTEVNFDDGLNIIVGESNNGKTSILRGIMWVIDNHPLGTDFIMAGEDECKVTVCYDDGTSITRGRTRKDTGYYDVYYRDENNTLQRTTYRGFTNAVPVEVANVHQMPKVNITKDIETHLNVLSQLDGPFLLTESPLVKASAIGRITGTHIIDAAVKDSNKAIQGNRKMIKAYADDLTLKQNELKAMPDVVLMEEFANLYNSVATYMKSLQDFIYELDLYEKQITSCDNLIVSEQVSLNQYKTQLLLLPVLQEAGTKHSYLNNLIQMSEAVYDVKDDIFIENRKLDRYKAFASLKPIINDGRFLHDEIRELETQYNAAITVSNQVDTEQEICHISKEYRDVLDSVLTYTRELAKYLEYTVHCTDEIQLIEEQQTVAIKEITAQKKNVKKIKDSIAKVQKEKNAFVVGYGICPCCGQAITDDHVQSITAFMEG